MADPLSREVAAAVKAVMTDHGITQAQIAKSIGKSQQYVSDRLGGKHSGTLDILAALAELTHLSPRAIMVEVTERMSRGD